MRHVLFIYAVQNNRSIEKENLTVQLMELKMKI